MNGYPESKALIHVLAGHSGAVTSCAISPDNSFVVSAGDDHTLRIWEAAGGAERATLRGHTGLVWACAISPEGSFVVSADEDYTLRIWEAAGGAERATLRGHTAGVEDCAISPDSSFVVSAGWDGTLRIWEAAGGAERATLRGHVDGVQACAISPDGSFIVSASKDRTLEDLGGVRRRRAGDAARSHRPGLDLRHQPRRQLHRLGRLGRHTSNLGGGQRRRAGDAARSHRLGLRTCAISPDGSFIVSAGWDGTLRIWEAAGGAERATLRGHTGGVEACAISPDGSFIVSGQLGRHPSDLGGGRWRRAGDAARSHRRGLYLCHQPRRQLHRLGQLGRHTSDLGGGRWHREGGAGRPPKRRLSTALSLHSIRLEAVAARDKAGLQKVLWAKRYEACWRSPPSICGDWRVKRTRGWGKVAEAIGL